MTQSQSQNQQSQSQSAPAGGGGAQPSSISSETRDDLEKAQQEQSGDTHRQTDTGIGASDGKAAGARQDEQADYGTPRGPSAAGSGGQAGENLTPTGADTGAVVNGLSEDRETPQPEQQRHANSEGAWASDADTSPELDDDDRDGAEDDDSAIGMNGE